MARIECLYDVPEKKKEPHRAIVTWLCRPAFMPRGLDFSHGMEEDGVPPLDNNHEVFGEVREFGVDIDAESIYMKCTVVEGEIYNTPSDFVKQHKQGTMPCYIQRFNLKNLKRNKFSIEPLRTVRSKKEKTGVTPGSPAVKVVTPLRVNLNNLRVSKRKLSESETTNSDSVKKAKMTGSRNVSKETSQDLEISPELSTFVTSTVKVVDEVVPLEDDITLRRSRRASKPIQVSSNFTSSEILMMITFY